MLDYHSNNFNNLDYLIYDLFIELNSKSNYAYPLYFYLLSLEHFG